MNRITQMFNDIFMLNADGLDSVGIRDYIMNRHKPSEDEWEELRREVKKYQGVEHIDW